MPYQQKPDSGTLWENERKQSDTHPDYKGDLLISRDLIRKIAKYGEAKIEISAWVGQTKAGKPRISITCKEPYKKDDAEPRYESDTPPEYASEPEPKQPPIAPNKSFTPEQNAQRYFDKLKTRLGEIKTLKEFETLYKNIYSDAVWQHFKAVPDIAKEASELLSLAKVKFALPQEPQDLSDLLSQIDVQIQRLDISAITHCKERWGKARQLLSADELAVYLSELKATEKVLSEVYF